MKMKIRYLAAAISLTAVFAVSAGVTGAYLTQTTKELNNVITGGSIGVKVTEPGWTQEQGQKLTPGSIVTKDPAAVNTGKNDAWVFLKVKVPVKIISLVDTETRKKQEAARMELLAFAASDKWELIEKTEDEDSACYIYGYRFVVKAGEKTEPLFQEVALVPYLEGELDETDLLVMPVEAMAVQTGVCEKGADLKTIFAEYLKTEETGAEETGAEETKKGGAAA